MFSKRGIRPYTYATYLLVIKKKKNVKEGKMSRKFLMHKYMDTSNFSDGRR